MPRSYTLSLLGDNELLMDRDNLMFTEDVSRWQKDPSNHDLQQAGDDRVPAWMWLGKLHYEDSTPERLVGIPVSMTSACIRAGATMIPHPTAKGGKTLKDVSQSGILITAPVAPIFVPSSPAAKAGEGEAWRTIAYSELFTKLRQEMDFEVHQYVASAMGCTLDVRRAKPPGRGTGRHVRVRPKFGPWKLMLDVTVTDDIITEDLLLRIFEYSGRYKGLGNWRPSTIRSGPYGTFKASFAEAPKARR